METFVKLTVVSKLGTHTERYFNMRFIRAVQESDCSVLLDGNINPFIITKESMEVLKKAMVEFSDVLTSTRWLTAEKKSLEKKVSEDAEEISRCNLLIEVKDNELKKVQAEARRLRNRSLWQIIHER